MVFSCVDSVGVVKGVRENAAVETAAVGSATGKLEFVTTDIDDGALNIVGDCS
jgi:hypothetical protein